MVTIAFALAIHTRGYLHINYVGRYVSVRVVCLREFEIPPPPFSFLPLLPFNRKIFLFYYYV